MLIIINLLSLYVFDAYNYYYYMYLMTLHKSLEEMNHGSGDSHVISLCKPVLHKNVSYMID